MINPSDSVFSSRVHTVFLDRDGVLNEKAPEGHFVFQWSEFKLLPGVIESIARMNRAGIRVIVVSNQRGVALGLYTAADVRALHRKFQDLLSAQSAHVDGFYFCPHDRDQCNCRKPLPGLFEQAERDFPDISAESSLMVGDSLPDIEFGRRLGMKTCFVDGKSEHQKPGAETARNLADLCVPSLVQGVDALLGEPSAAQ